MISETVTIPKCEYVALKREARVLRSSQLYKRLLEFEQNIANGKKFTRKDLGF
ncbi:MAG: hypothetical protein V1777_00610 [Candidatus Micrarchaeota archaeon]